MQNSINQNFAPRSVSNDSQLFLLVIIIGGGIYGATLGLWRSSLQAILVAVKFPFLICLTMVGTGLINGMLAQVMGADISFRRCFQVTVRSYALLVIILESFVPLSLFILFNLPPMGSNTVPFAHSIFLSAHVILISFAGVRANLYLFGSLTTVCTTRGKALQILFSWLGTSMFLGCQLSLNLRPFFGSPSLPVGFLRDHPFEDSFNEAIFYTVLSLIDKL